MMEVVEEVEAEGPAMVAFPWAATGRGHSPSSVNFQHFPLAGAVPGFFFFFLLPKRYRYTGLAACETKWCLLKHSKTGDAVCDEVEIHPDGDGPLQGKISAGCKGCKCRMQSPQAECLDAQVPSSDGADAVQVMQRALPLFPAPLNRPVISFT